MLSFAELVEREMAPAPARVLEVGCGAGVLATRLAAAGHDVVAIDPSAPPGPLFRRLKLSEVDPADGPFDAIVAQHSLHHVGDLEAAADRIVELLRPGGLVLVDELAWERLDGPTLDWLYGQRRALAATRGSEPPGSIDALAAEWEADHVGLHTGAALLFALGARFAPRLVEDCAGLYGALGGVATAVLEQALVEQQAIAPIGFRFVGVRA